MKIIYTSALIENKFEERKKNYIESYNSLLNYFRPDDIYIVECYSSEPNFFSELHSPIHITNTHDKKLKNKGVLELKGLINFLNFVKIENNYFLKLTGRYKILDDYLIKTVNNNIGYDFYGKLIDDNTQIFTGYFVIKTSVIKEFLEYVDINVLESQMINFEKILLDYLKEKNKKCFFLDKLNINAPIFGTGDITTYII